MWTLFITTLLHGRIIRDKTHISLYADTSLIWRMSIILWNMPSSASPKTTMKCTKQSPDPFMMSKDYNTQGEKVGYLKIYLCSMNLHEPFFSTSWEIDRNKNIYIQLSHQCFFWGADHSFAWLDTVIYGYPQCKHSPSSHESRLWGDREDALAIRNIAGIS